MESIELMKEYLTQAVSSLRTEIKSLSDKIDTIVIYIQKDIGNHNKNITDLYAKDDASKKSIADLCGRVCVLEDNKNSKFKYIGYALTAIGIISAILLSLFK